MSLVRVRPSGQRWVECDGPSCRERDVEAEGALEAGDAAGRMRGDRDRNFLLRYCCVRVGRGLGKDRAGGAEKKAREKEAGLLDT